MKNKRIYFLAGLLLSAAGMLFIIVRNNPTEIPRQEVNLRAPTNDVSLEDMMKSINNRDRSSSTDDAMSNVPSSSQNSQIDNPEAISRIQTLIRANKENMSSGLQEIENERQGIYSHVDERDVFSTITPSPAPGVSRPQRTTESKIVAKKEKVEDPLPDPEPEPETKKRSPFNSVSMTGSDNKNAIKAYVHSEQIVTDGSTLKMRLGEDAYTDNGTFIPKNSPIFGEVVSIDGERVNVRITQINVQGNILPFKKDVYSKDALLGIYVPGNAKSDAAKDVTGGIIDGLPTSGIPGVDAATQIAGVVASTAAQAGKQAASKNVKKVKVTIKTNYEIFLRPDEKR